MLIRRALLFSLLFLCFAAASVDAQRTSTPSPTPRRGAVNRTRVRNVVRGLQLNAAADEYLPACWTPSASVSAWNVANPLTSGQLTDLSFLSRGDDVVMRIAEAIFPAICSTEALTGAVVISPGGATLPALSWTYDGTPPHYEGFTDPYNVAQLPLAAYRQPGVWRLSVSGPQPYEIQIRVPAPSGPFALLDPINGGYLIGGFTPGENVLGVLYSSLNDDLQDAFEFTVDANGYGSIDGHRFEPPAALYLVGDRGSGWYYPFGTVLFGGDRTDIPGIEDGVQPDEMYALLRSVYFDASSPPPVAQAATCGGVTLRLAVGGQARRAGNTNVRIRNNPSRSATQIGLINNTTPVSVLAGPQCVSGVPWWQVNYNGIVGWAAEAADGLTLLAPVGSAPPPANNVPPGGNVPTLVPTVRFVPTDTPVFIPTDPPVVSTGTLDFGAAPNFGSVDLTSGFSPDPYAVGLVSGGSVDVSYLGGACVGYATAAPDFRLHYTSGGFSLLRIYFVGGGDTTLIINDPFGGWHCSDDSFGALNPSLDFGSPASGQYDIWVGSYSVGTSVSGTLYVTEQEGNHP